VRRSPGVAERDAQLAHAADQDVFRDVDVRPECGEQLVLRHQLPGAEGQVLEDGERLATQRHDLLAAMQPRVRGVEREASKADPAIALSPRVGHATP